MRFVFECKFIVNLIVFLGVCKVVYVYCLCYYSVAPVTKRYAAI